MRTPAWICALLLLLGSGCGRGAASPSSTSAAAAELDVGPLLELVPPGPEAILMARPKELATQQAALLLWRAVVPEDRERAFTERTGVDPLRLEELVVFEVPPTGYVLLARGPFDAVDVVRRAGERLAIVDVSVDAPSARREGLRGDGRYAYAALDAHAVLGAREAPPALLGDILARRLDRSLPRALDGADAQALRHDHATSPAWIIAPRPLALPTTTGVGLLLARERALAAAVSPSADAFEVALDLRGEFPQGAEQNFRVLMRSLGSMPLGAAFGLTSVAERMTARTDDTGVLLSFRVAATDLVAGVRMVFFEDMRELLGLDDVADAGVPGR